MREEHGSVAGDVVVYEDFTLWGSVSGNVKVIAGGRFYVRGAIYGNLVVEEGGRVHIFGRISGHLRLMVGTKVINSGVVGGDLINEGGRYYGELGSHVLGKIKPKSGETNLPD
jgi:hypothetical protein